MIIHHASYKPDDILTSEFFSAYLLWFGFYQFPKEMANPTAAFIYENFLPLGVTISTQIKSNHNDIMTSNYFAQYDPAINNVVERAHTHTHTELTLKWFRGSLATFFDLIYLQFAFQFSPAVNSLKYCPFQMDLFS